MLLVGSLRGTSSKSRRRARVHLTVDLEIVAPAVGVAELRGERLHQRDRQRVEVERAVRLVLIQERMPARFGVGAVLLDDRPNQAIAVAEVVLQRAPLRWPAARLISRRETPSIPRAGEERSAARMICSARVSSPFAVCHECRPLPSASSRSLSYLHPWLIRLH